MSDIPGTVGHNNGYPTHEESEVSDTTTYTCEAS